MKKIPFLPNRYYHIKNCANNNEYLFYEDKNYRHFLRLYKRHVSKTADLIAYCLLENRFEMLVRIKDDTELPERFKERIHQPFSNMFNAYTKGMNSLYGRNGSLFQEHFKREEIQSSGVAFAIAEIKLLPSVFPKSKFLCKVTEYSVST
ncbi:transposase [Flavobacterium sp. MAH-1]|uniref:Transposase n=1 Tax=Flavobacterium agri TaxID=2743471 RepID=A0A7Y9C787_9FLAO|nr:transposase [Flavobacterium agri]NUY81169.1 transposase [Flavobacterium agri]NYA71193.1 transposase [Flavobacterium agri]